MANALSTPSQSRRPSIVILAAGLGSRYGGFKQIEPFGAGGEIILDYSIYDARRAGFGQVVIVTVPELEPLLRDHLRKTQGEDLDLVFVYQSLNDVPLGFAVPPNRTKPWGTAHAIRAARHHLDGPFAMINADDFYGPSSYILLHDFLVSDQRTQMCIVGFELGKTLSDYGTVSRGICQVNPDNELVAVIEHTKIERDDSGVIRSLQNDGEVLAPDSIASMNMFGFDASLFEPMEKEFRQFLELRGADPKAEFFIPAVVDALVNKSGAHCKVLRSPEQWFGVTYKEDRKEAGARLQRLAAEGIYPPTLQPTPTA